MLETIIAAVIAHFGFVPRFARPFFDEWARCENTSASFNPFASTWTLPGSTGFNDDGVQNYATLDDGIRATILTLDPQSANPAFIDWYPAVRRVLAVGSIDGQGLRSQLVQQIAKWGTNDFAAEIAGGWNPSLDPEPEAAPTLTVDELAARIDSLNRGTLARFAALQRGDTNAAANPSVVPDYAYDAPAPAAPAAGPTVNDPAFVIGQTT